MDDIQHTREILAKNLVKLRGEMTIAYVCERTGLTRRTIYNLENRYGDIAPTLSTLHVLADLYEVRLGELFE